MTILNSWSVRAVGAASVREGGQGHCSATHSAGYATAVRLRRCIGVPVKKKKRDCRQGVIPSRSAM